MITQDNYKTIYKTYELPENFYVYKKIPTKKYSFKKIERIVNWFLKNYGDFIRREGWYIGMYSNSNYHTKLVYVLEMVGKNISNFDEAKFKAEQFGFIIDSSGVIFGFSKKKFEKNKHVLIGYELGLL